MHRYEKETISCENVKPETDAKARYSFHFYQIYIESQERRGTPAYLARHEQREDDVHVEAKADDGETGEENGEAEFNHLFSLQRERERGERNQLRAVFYSSLGSILLAGWRLRWKFLMLLGLGK